MSIFCPDHQRAVATSLCDVSDLFHVRRGCLNAALDSVEATAASRDLVVDVSPFVDLGATVARRGRGRVPRGEGGLKFREPTTALRGGPH